MKIEVLSRFTTAREQKRILGALRAGGVDLLIGTHKLLQKSVEFHDLGLLVIDEEQRFGVTHKERLKEMSSQVDVLTLSATPIPRTLNMALSGLRDMSTLEEPPADRQPVQTYVLEHDWAIIEDAVRRELGRGGQVYYLHNRVGEHRLHSRPAPEAAGTGGAHRHRHGKMSEQELSSVMQAMVDGEADILVCTTIIETGIDIPNVNTLIIEDADRMGLAQLHQIRGRIGRSARRAYAYLTYRRGKVLQETAAKRLAAIREYVEFGSGFKIAMRDLEIRGAGNLLGPEQSGYLMSVGYDLYLKLLEEAVLEERGEERDRDRVRRRPHRQRPHPGPVRPLPGAADGPVPPHRRHPHRRGRLGPAGRDAGPVRRGAQECAGPAGRGAAPGAPRLWPRLRYLPEGQPAALPAGDLPAEALVAVCGLAKYRQRLTLAAGEVARPDAEAPARRGRAGGRPHSGGGPEAGLGGRRTVRRAGRRLSAPCASHCHIAPARIGCQRWDSPAPSGAGALFHNSGGAAKENCHEDEPLPCVWPWRPV